MDAASRLVQGEQKNRQGILWLLRPWGGGFGVNLCPTLREFSRFLFELENKSPGMSRGSTLGKTNDKCINSGIFPSKWKDSNLTPVFKSGQKEVVTNFRGIALLPILSKVLERCVHSIILNLIEPYLSPSQPSFTRDRSCITQLLHYVHDLATSLDAGEQIDNIYLAMEKAFDRGVLHEKRLHKLEVLGIRNSLQH